MSKATSILRRELVKFTTKNDGVDIIIRGGNGIMGIQGDEFVERAERIGSRSEFSTFAKELVQNLRQHPEEWGNTTLDEFVQGLAGFAENMEGYYANIGATVDCDVPSWRIFADILLAARVYE